MPDSAYPIHYQDIFKAQENDDKLYQNDNGTVHFQQGIFNDATDYTSMITHQ